jgi:predicted nucleic-acid-binding protein
LISSPGIEITEPALYPDALDRYQRTETRFVDFLIASAVVAAMPPVATFDRDFPEFGDVPVEV